jgi:hypothetical protein
LHRIAGFFGLGKAKYTASTQQTHARLCFLFKDYNEKTRPQKARTPPRVLHLEALIFVWVSNDQILNAHARLRP